VEDALRVEADVHGGAALRGRRDVYSAARRPRKRGSTAAAGGDYHARMANEPGPSRDVRPTPDLAALFRAASPPPAWWRRPAVLLALLAAAAAAAVGGALALSSRVTPGEGMGAEGDRTLSPIAASLDPRTGERTAPFEGFAVSVETIPPGALVSIDGVERGEAPLLSNLACAPGDRVEVTARLPGLAPGRVETTCRANTLAQVVVRLSR
jgi:hypothetical protein